MLWFETQGSTYFLIIALYSVITQKGCFHLRATSKDPGGFSPAASAYSSMMSRRVNSDYTLIQLVASGSSHFLIRVVENVSFVLTKR